MGWYLVGASYTTRSAMSRFRKYSGLIPEHGRCDTPAVASWVLHGNLWMKRPSRLNGSVSSMRIPPFGGNSFRVFRAVRGAAGQQAGNTDGPGFVGRTLLSTNLVWIMSGIIPNRTRWLFA